MLCMLTGNFRDSSHIPVPAPPIPAQQEVLTIYGIMGFIRLQAGNNHVSLIWDSQYMGCTC
ncbi:hypothetical protein BC937DRAFT_90522 [Endogone sp. FLAS-F59071]|nr:hypothetical protein BC937DRAFT_90522 [Endogone sp. FLAS-F59071]|eukprot:RUS17024.1 hypothetical protein BC937DRAFT_90522 [Endogone sp. FLAS-F59071]